MPKLPWKRVSGGALGALSFWRSVRALSVKEIAEEAERPFEIAVIGTEDQARLLAARLALESPTPRDGAHGPANVWPYLRISADGRDLPSGSLVLHADSLTADETALAQALARMVVEKPDLRLSLARHVPAFRPAAVGQIIQEASWDNARIALVSALPGVLPFLGLLMPVAAVGDMVVLTKNQGLMLLKIAAAYGLPVDLRARTRELLPIVGGAFGWRAVARELVGLVPGGFGVAIKGTVAYAGTYTVGKAAAIYYSTGQTLSGPRLKQLYRDAARDAGGRVRQWLRREKTARVPSGAGRGILRRGRNNSRPQSSPEQAERGVEVPVDKTAPVGV